MGILLEQRIQGQGEMAHGSPGSACVFVSKLQGTERGPEVEVHRKAGMQGGREGVWPGCQELTSLRAKGCG